MGNYYKEDYSNPARMKYFDNQFLKLSKLASKRQGIPFSAFLSQIVDYKTFVAVLGVSFDEDDSLSSYFMGLDDEDLELFFKRPKIQEIVNANLEGKFEKVARIEAPKEVIQVNKKTRVLFRAILKERKTGKIRRVVAKRTFVIVKGKRQLRFRDSMGRFVKAIIN